MITDRADAPRQGREGAPDAWLELDASLTAALDGLQVGDEVVVITWLHLADRETQTVHPRNDLSRLCGVFATRSPAPSFATIPSEPAAGFSSHTQRLDRRRTTRESSARSRAL